MGYQLFLGEGKVGGITCCLSLYFGGVRSGGALLNDSFKPRAREDVLAVTNLGERKGKKVG